MNILYARMCGYKTMFLFVLKTTPRACCILVLVKAVTVPTFCVRHPMYYNDILYSKFDHQSR